jgi:hypothetical protein
MSQPLASAPADVNWLLSTSVQSGAALVAIIGGLLISRLVNLAAERNALIRRSTEEERLAELANEAAREAAHRIERFNLDHFLTYAHTEIQEAHGALDVGQLDDLIANSGWDVSEEHRSRLIRETLPRIQAVFVLVEEGFRNGTGDGAGSGEEAILTSAPDGTTAELIDDVVAQVRKERVKPSGALGLGSLVSVGLPRDAAFAASERQTRDRREDDLNRVLAEAQSDERSARTRIALIADAIESATRPPDLQRTLWSLGYLSVACLVFPLILMSFAPVSLSPWVRALVVLAFISGLAVFFAELIRLARGGKP